jgi:hypothetical protein
VYSFADSTTVAGNSLAERLTANPLRLAVMCGADVSTVITMCPLVPRHLVREILPRQGPCVNTTVDEGSARPGSDPSVRVVTVCGAGKVFSAGQDLADVKEVADAAARGEPHPEVDALARPTLMKSWY